MNTTEMSERLRSLLADSRHAVFVVESSSSRIVGWAHVEHRQSLEGGQNL